MDAVLAMFFLGIEYVVIKSGKCHLVVHSCLDDNGSLGCRFASTVLRRIRLGPLYRTEFLSACLVRECIGVWGCI